MKNKHLYPKNWKQIALKVKDAADWHCQECEKMCRRPGEHLNDFCKRRNWYYEDVLDAPQRFTLTVAHLDHNPSNCDLSNLKALCSVCHLKYDLRHHIQSRSSNRYKNRENLGQLTLF